MSIDPAEYVKSFSIKLIKELSESIVRKREIAVARQNELRQARSLAAAKGIQSEKEPVIVHLGGDYYASLSPEKALASLDRMISTHQTHIDRYDKQLDSAERATTDLQRISDEVAAQEEQDRTDPLPRTVNDAISSGAIVDAIEDDPFLTEDGLPIMEIVEELDENDNITSTNVRPQKSLELAQFANDKLASLLENRDDLLLGSQKHEEQQQQPTKVEMIDGKVVFGPEKPSWILEGKENPYTRRRIKAGVYGKPHVTDKSVTSVESTRKTDSVKAFDKDLDQISKEQHESSESDAESDLSAAETDSSISQAPDDVPYNAEEPAIPRSELLELELIANDIDDESDFDDQTYNGIVDKDNDDDDDDEDDDEDDDDDDDDDEDEFGRTRGTLFPMSMASRVQDELNRVRGKTTTVENVEVSEEDIEETHEHKKGVRFNEVISVKRFDKNPPKKKPAHSSGMISTKTNFEPLNDADTYEVDRRTVTRTESRTTPRAAIISHTGPPVSTASKSTTSETYQSIVQARTGLQPPKKPVNTNITGDSEKPARVSRFKTERAAAGINFIPKPHIPNPAATAAALAVSAKPKKSNNSFSPVSFTIIEREPPVLQKYKNESSELKTNVRKISQTTEHKGILKPVHVEEKKAGTGKLKPTTKASSGSKSVENSQTLNTTLKTESLKSTLRPSAVKISTHKTSPTKTSPTKTSLTKTSPTKTSPTKTSPTKTSSTKTSPTKTSSTKNSPVKVSPTLATPTKPLNRPSKSSLPNGKFQPLPPKARTPSCKEPVTKTLPGKTPVAKASSTKESTVPVPIVSDPKDVPKKVSRFKTQASKSTPSRFPASSRIEELESKVIEEKIMEKIEKSPDQAILKEAIQQEEKDDAPLQENIELNAKTDSHKEPLHIDDTEDGIYERYQEASGTIINPALINGLRSIIPAEVLKKANEYYKESLMTEEDFIKAHLGEQTKEEEEKMKEETEIKEREQKEKEKKKKERPVLAQTLIERETAPEIDGRGMGYLPDHLIKIKNNSTNKDNEEEGDDIDDDDQDYSVSRRELMEEYQKARQSLIYSTGGFGKTPEEMEIEPVEEEDTLGSRKMSRFKMARLSNRRF